MAFTSFHASKLLVRALGDISKRYDRWYVAKSPAVAMGCRHGRHGSELEMVVD